MYLKFGGKENETKKGKFCNADCVAAGGAVCIRLCGLQ